MLTEAQRVPSATYRLQLRKEFPFAALEAAAPYLRSLGITDCYCSPVLFSTPGSTHGYDVNDYRRIDPELGGKEGLNRLHAALAARGMGLLLDFVPNHMGINGPGPFNTWWQNVLEWGEGSPYSEFFDINWRDRDGGSTQILVPILDDHYGRVLEAGRLGLVEENGRLAIAYGEMRFPVSPETCAHLLEAAAARSEAHGGELRAFAEKFLAAPAKRGANRNEAKERVAAVQRLKQELGAYLDQEPEAREAVQVALRDLGPGGGEPVVGAGIFDRLDELIEMQHYRLAYWKAGTHETNYRRFFAIDSLIGLRIENPEVFAECHALLQRLLREGLVTGLRIDHVDGLWDPAEYLQRLQGLGADAPVFVVVEKILSEGEALPGDWMAHGTTGYEFISQLAGLMVDGRSEAEFTRTYAAFTGEEESFPEVIYAKKRLVLEEMFANAVSHLADGLVEIREADRRWRDLTQHELTVAVRELMAALSVYRTYRREDGTMGKGDREKIERAKAEAVRRNLRLGAEPFEFVQSVLVGDYPGEKAARWALTFQQYTGAITAKAVEDTAFYTYNRLIALNEVGGNPASFGGTIAQFHGLNRVRAQEAPHSLLASSTHDTKLGEDARARLYALSEIPHEWREWIAEWRGINRRNKTLVDGRSAPDENEEYRLYQILLAAWPADGEPGPEFRARLRDHVRKAVSEAKRNTSWVNPNEAWLEAGDRFIEGMLDPVTGAEFLGSIRPKARRLAHLGMVNSLAQLALKAMSPGVPDFYQGSEGWLLHLVDPDNRGVVDFAEAEKRASLPDAPLREQLANWEDGAVKRTVMRALLRFREQAAPVFQAGAYAPLTTEGTFADNVVAFARTLPDGTAAVVVVPRLTAGLGVPPLGLVWDDTRVALPFSVELREVVTGRSFDSAGGLLLRDLFVELPLAVLFFEPRMARMGTDAERATYET